MHLAAGDTIRCNGAFDCRVTRVARYASFGALLEAESLARVLPGVATVDAGVAVYRQFYAADDERARGVLAIGVRRIGGD
jgi:ASC-1-like (ASCH) protein